MASDDLPISSNDNRRSDFLNENNNLTTTDGEIDLSEIWKSVVRKKRILFVTASFIFLLSIINTVKRRVFNPIYSGSFSVLISDPLDSSQNRGNQAGNITSVFKNIANNATQNDIPTLIQLLKSPYLLKDLSSEFKLNPNSLSNSISIVQAGSKLGLAEVLNVSISSSSVVEGQKILERLSQVYLQAAIDQKKRRLNTGLAFLDEQAPSLLEKNNRLESRLAEFRIKNSLILPTEKGTSIKSSQRDIDLSILEITERRNRLKDIRKKIENSSLSARGFSEVITNGGNNGLAVSDFDQTLLEQLLEVEEELAKARTKYTEGSVVVKALQSKLDRIQPMVLENQFKAVDTAISLNDGILKTKISQRNELERNFSKQPLLIKEFNTLQQQLELSKSNLIGLEAARESFQLEMAQSTAPWKLISPPIMQPNPIKPSISKNLTFGAILGLIIGVLASLIRDRLDKVFHNPTEVKEKLSIPLLGHIPYIDFASGVRENKESIIDKLNNENKFSNSKNLGREYFLWQESMRNISTSIRFLDTDNQIRSIAFTSSIATEGKSASIIMLAKSLTDLGLRVLIVDADLRKPQMHIRLGLNNIQGLSNLLIDSQSSYKDFIQKVPGSVNWFLLTSGQNVPDPTRLLSSKRMNYIAQELAESNEFDYILYDTTPVLGLSDPAILSRNLDGYVLLVSINKVDCRLPASAINRMNSIGNNLLGCITSNTEKSEVLANDNYGEYGEYGYYYGDDDVIKEENLINKNFLDKFSNNNVLIKKINPLINKIRKFLLWIDN